MKRPKQLESAAPRDGPRPLPQTRKTYEEMARPTRRARRGAGAGSPGAKRALDTAAGGTRHRQGPVHVYNAKSWLRTAWHGSVMGVMGVGGLAVGQKGNLAPRGEGGHLAAGSAALLVGGVEDCSFQGSAVKGVPMLERPRCRRVTAQSLGGMPLPRGMPQSQGDVRGEPLGQLLRTTLLNGRPPAAPTDKKDKKGPRPPPQTRQIKIENPSVRTAATGGKH